MYDRCETNNVFDRSAFINYARPGGRLWAKGQRGVILIWCAPREVPLRPGAGPPGRGRHVEDGPSSRAASQCASNRIKPQDTHMYDRSFLGIGCVDSSRDNLLKRMREPSAITCSRHPACPCHLTAPNITHCATRASPAK